MMRSTKTAAAVFLLFFLTIGSAGAETADERQLRICAANAESLLEKLKKNPDKIYWRSFESLQRRCVSQAPADKTAKSYQELKKNYETIKDLVERRSEQGETQIGIEKALEKAYRSHGSAMLNDQSGTEKQIEDRSRRGVEAADSCIKQLEQLFAQQPSAKKMSPPGARKKTGAVMLADCSKAKKRHGAAVAKYGGERMASVQKSLEYLGKEYLRIKKSQAQARKDSRSKKKYRGIMAADRYSMAFRDILTVEKELKHKLDWDAKHLRGKPLQLAGSRRTPESLLEEISGVYKKIKKERAANKPRADREERMWKEEFMKKLKGDRRSIAKKYSIPLSWQGHDSVDPNKKLKSATRSKWWIYERTGCRTEYRFKGNKKVAQVSKPHGCRL